MTGKPWENEPDSFDVVDKATGYPIALRRHPGGGHWTGFVGVPLSHPWHGVHHDLQKPVPEHVSPTEFGIVKLFVSPSEMVKCHGGLTNAGQIDSEAAEWWLGFDCAHAGDLCPFVDESRADEVYRDLDFVLDQARKLASGIAEFEAAHLAARGKP